MKRNLTKLGILLLGMVFSASLSLAQNVTGVVTDADTGELLIGANVLIVDTATGVEAFPFLVQPSS